MTPDHDPAQTPASDPPISPDQGGSLLMLPGLAPRVQTTTDLTRATRIALDAREQTGLLDPLDAALSSLALADAIKLDATVYAGRPSGRAKLLGAMSDVLEALPSPSAQARGMLAAYLAALTGRDHDHDAEDPADAVETLPIVDPPTDATGVTETGVRTALRARHAAGLSTRFSAAHEALALMAAHDLDRAQTVGAPSGFALLASVLQTILERLPRPETDADAGDVDDLLATALADDASPFTVLPTAAHHPERDPEWLSEGAEIAAVARAMGRHLMPWQRKAIDVATEYRLDALGRRRYRYTKVLITVPRQSGKTDLTIPVQVHRALTRGGEAACWYTAQSGQDARKRIMDLIERVEGGLMRLLFTSTRSNGAEGVRVTEQSGAHVTRFSPTFSALHGEHPHLVTMDEVWHYSKDLGEALLGAIEPAQITLGARAQLWQISTMGTVASDYFNDLIEVGRAGTDPDLCYVEYSLPDDADPFDPDAWPLFHPALGNTIEVEDLAKRARSAQNDPAKRATWMRAYCNRVVASDGTLVDLALWDDLAITVPAPDPTTVTLAFEVAPDAASAAVVAAWTDTATGRPCIRVVHQAAGTDWLVPYVDEIAPTFAGLAADGAGPAARFVSKLVENGHEIRTLTLPEFGQATEALLDYAGPSSSLIHDGTPELREQVAAVEVRRSNGVRRFSRDSPRPVLALIAGAVGLFAHEHPTAEAGSFVL